MTCFTFNLLIIWHSITLKNVSIYGTIFGSSGQDLTKMCKYQKGEIGKNGHFSEYKILNFYKFLKMMEAMPIFMLPNQFFVLATKKHFLNASLIQYWLNIKKKYQNLYWKIGKHIWMNIIRPNLHYLIFLYLSTEFLL